MTSVSSTSSLIQNYINTYEKSSTASTSTASSSSSATTLSADMNTFLKILTTQLQNQDPTEATNTDQFTQELVQFAQVEQQINTNDKLDDMIKIMDPNGVTPLVNYVGRTVEASTNGSIEVQDGEGDFSYTLASQAQTATITIKNSDGDTVATLQGSAGKGTHKIAWVAQNTSGTALDDGTYTVSVVAKDSNGEKVTVSSIDAIGVVTSIQTASDGTSTLSMGDLNFSASDVSAVYTGMTSASSGSSSSASSSSTSS